MGSLNRKQVEEVVDKWAEDFKLYLDGRLHFKARDGLVDRMMGVEVEQPKRGPGRPRKEKTDAA